MPDISMLDLRSNLTDVLREVERGQIYTVNRFGKTIAMLVPPGTLLLDVPPPAPDLVEADE